MSLGRLVLQISIRQIFTDLIVFLTILIVFMLAFSAGLAKVMVVLCSPALLVYRVCGSVLCFFFVFFFFVFYLNFQPT